MNPLKTLWCWLAHRRHVRKEVVIDEWLSCSCDRCHRMWMEGYVR